MLKYRGFDNVVFKQDVLIPNKKDLQAAYDSCINKITEVQSMDLNVYCDPLQNCG